MHIPFGHLSICKHEENNTSNLFRPYSSGYLNFPQWKSELGDAALESARQNIYLSYFYKSIGLDEQQQLIDGLTGKEGWHLTTEESQWGETQNLSFPFTLNYQASFSSPNNDKEWAMLEQLYVYSQDRGWLLLFSRVGEYTDGNYRVLEEKTETLWDEGRS